MREMERGRVQLRSRAHDDGPVVHEIGMKWPTSRWLGFKKVEIFEQGEEVCLRVEVSGLIDRFLIAAVIFVANGFWVENKTAFFGTGFLSLYIAAGLYFLNSWRIRRWWRGLKPTLD